MAEHNPELLFAKTLEEVKKKAVINHNFVLLDDICEAFAGQDLTVAQLSMVVDFLKTKGITVSETEEVLGEDTAEETSSDTESEVIYGFEEMLKAVNAVDFASDGEKQAVFLNAMAGVVADQQRLIEAYMPRVNEIAKIYDEQGVYTDDLVGEGLVALVSGVTMLGAAENASDAEGMLIHMIMDAMEELVNEALGYKKEDETVTAKVNLLAEKAATLSHELMRKVTYRELAEETDFSLEEIEELDRLTGYKIEDIARK